jgi:hypothetical protein
VRASLREIAAASDPKKAIFNAVGELDDYDIFHNLILVATFIQPPMKMKGPDGKEIDFHFTDKTLMEDRFQGKVGLVLKMGPLAFEDDGIIKFGGVKVQRGDWVIYRPSDGIEQFVRDRNNKNVGIACRIMEDAHIKGRVSDPGMIY